MTRKHLEVSKVILYVEPANKEHIMSLGPSEPGDFDLKISNHREI